MNLRILICGANGAGKSTLGADLSKLLKIPFFDIEDYFFDPRTAEYPYSMPLSKSEALQKLFIDLQNSDNFILAAVNGELGLDIEALINCVVWIKAPLDLRLKRIEERSFKRFGKRVLLGGDLYEAEKQFYSKVAARSDAHITEWLSKSGLPAIEIDGSKKCEENTAAVLEKLAELLKEKTDEI